MEQEIATTAPEDEVEATEGEEAAAEGSDEGTEEATPEDGGEA